MPVYSSSPWAVTQLGECRLCLEVRGSSPSAPLSTRTRGNRHRPASVLFVRRGPRSCSRIYQPGEAHSLAIGVNPRCSPFGRPRPSQAGIAGRGLGEGIMIAPLG